jgi:demethylspheroidene O-methyltransferase
VIEQWQAARDRLLTSARFQRWAVAVPGLRWIAQRRARAVFDVVAGFVYSQVLHACVVLDVFERVAKKPLTVDELAADGKLPHRGYQTLVSAAVALRLLQRRRGDRFGLGALGAPLVGNLGLRNLVLHHSLFYQDLTDTLALLRGDHAPTRMASYWPYANTDTPNAATPDGGGTTASGTYSALMTSTQTLIASEVLTAYRFGDHRCLLDVGGGEGEFLLTVGERYPALQLMLFDLAPVAVRAGERLAERGFSGRSSVRSGDFFIDPLPTGADIISIVRVLHDHDDARVLTLLRNAHQALPAGGRLLIAEPMAETPGAEPVGDAYFGLYFLAMGRGKARSFAQIKALLMSAGFARVQQRPTRLPLQTGVVIATRAT